MHLGELISADIFAYAVMSNHYHVVLYIDKERAAHWSTEEVAERWLTLCPPALAQEWIVAYSSNINRLRLYAEEKRRKIVKNNPN